MRDIRNIGLIAGIEFEQFTDKNGVGKVGAFAFATYLKCYELGLHVRFTGDIIAISPPLTIEKHEIDRIFNTLADAITFVSAQGEKGIDQAQYLKNEQAWAAASLLENQSMIEHAALKDLGHHHIEHKLEYLNKLEHLA